MDYSLVWFVLKFFPTYRQRANLRQKAGNSTINKDLVSMCFMYHNMFNEDAGEVKRLRIEAKVQDQKCAQQSRSE